LKAYVALVGILACLVKTLMSVNKGLAPLNSIQGESYEMS